jgi:hypothetical protein
LRADPAEDPPRDITDRPKGVNRIARAFRRLDMHDHSQTAGRLASASLAPKAPALEVVPSSGLGPEGGRLGPPPLFELRRVREPSKVAP